MPLKTQEELIKLLNAAIRSDGVGGKTSAADVRGFLTTIVSDLLDGRQLTESQLLKLASADLVAQLAADLASSDQQQLALAAAQQVQEAALAALQDGKVDKVKGLQLSEQSYTTAEQQKLASLAMPAIEQDISSGSSTSVPSVRAVLMAGNSLADSLAQLKVGKADLVNGTVPAAELPLATASAPGIAQAGAGLVATGPVLSTVATSNVAVQTPASVIPVPYSSLESAFAGYKPLLYADITTRTTFIQAKTLTIGANVSISSYVKSDVSTVYIPNGLSVTCAGSFYIDNVVFDVITDAATIASGKVTVTGLRNSVESLDANTFNKCRIYADFDVSGKIILVDTYVDNIISATNAAATIYLYGSSAIGNISSTSPNVIIVDRTQQNVVPLLPFPAINSTQAITLKSGTRYFRDGSILQYVGVNNASSATVAFLGADAAKWQVISSPGFTLDEINAFKNVFETVGDSASGGSPSRTSYDDFTQMLTTPNKTLNIRANSDAGWYFSSNSVFQNIQYVNGNGYYISIGDGVLIFNYGVVVKDFTLSQYSISKWKLASFQATYVNGISGLNVFSLTIKPGDITNPATCAQFINSNVYGRLLLGNTAVALRDSYVMEIGYPGGSSLSGTSSRVYLYGCSKFGAFNYSSASRIKVFDYRPYTNTLIADASALKFTEDTYLRLVTAAGAPVTVNVNTANAVPMAQCRLIIPATAGTFNLLGNVRAFNDFVPGVDNVLYITYISNNNIVCYINQPISGAGADLAVTADLNSKSATSVPSGAAVATYVAAPKTYFASTAIRNAVAGGAFTNGELQGAQPSGSVFGMRFADTTYQYTYSFAAADTDGTALAWVRTAKS
jgi:hypothetical protein